jgi:hypothetical protein
MIWHVLHSDHGIQFRTTTAPPDWTVLVFEPAEPSRSAEAVIQEEEDADDAEEP